MRNNLQPVYDDNIEKELSITIPYYTMDRSSNNQSIQVKFNQLSKYNPTSGEYLKPTSVLIDGHQTDGVTVTSSDESTISINEDSVTNEGFSFTAKKSTGNNQYVTLTITANVYNGDFDEITKTIKVKVDSNVALGYVDSIYVFNKPVVDAEFIGKVLAGNGTQVDSTKLKAEIAKDKTLKYVAYNDRLVPSNSDFVLVLPYSNNNNITYNDIFKHVLLNPANIQYDGEEITTAWYKNIKVTSDDNNVLQVNQDSSSGEVKLYPKNVTAPSGGKAKCSLTFKDGKSGSAGASIPVPVRIVAQTTDVELAYGSNKTTSANPDIEVVAATNSDYEVNINYTFIAPNRENAKTLLEEACLNNAYKLSFNKTEMDVKLKGENKALEPNTEYTADYGNTLAKVTGSSGASTRYTATLTFVVTVKMDTTGAAKFTFIKNGSDLYGTDDNNSLKSKDKAVELSASFKITESAKQAWIVKAADDDGDGYNTALNIVTNNGESAGEFVWKSNNEAWVYVQNHTANTELSILSPANVKQFVRADKSYFEIKNYTSTARNSTVLSRDSKTEILSFAGGIANPNEEAGSVTFEVHNVGNKEIAKLTIRIYVIDAVTD
ncbi:MAG: hypothetical protein K2O39_01750, partial [Clostridiales bacterium]|nr:hypothetical protein [Clostridiales bacterium]